VSERARERGYRCSARSVGLGEASLGTASTVRSWLLVEQPGAWPETAMDSRAIPRRVALALSRAANRHRVRLVLIRRPGRAPARPQGSTCFLAHTSRADPWLARLVVPALADLLELNLAALAAGTVPEPAARVDGPLFCVCTHGRHDPCCAERGRPVAAALAAEFPEQTWEVSHIGGDRFAANVLCLPHGIYLGRVPALAAAGVARSYLGGEVTVEYLRGRASDAPPVQAADSFLRQRLGLTAIEATTALRRQVDGEIETVTFTVREPGGGSRQASVRIRVSSPGPARALTCHASAEEAPPAYELLGISRS
jgi:hypothetical protein